MGDPVSDESLLRFMLQDHIRDALRILTAKWERIIVEAIAMGFLVEDLIWQTEPPWPGRPIRWKLVHRDGRVIAHGEDGEVKLD